MASTSKLSEEFKRKCSEIKQKEEENKRESKEIKRVLDDCKKAEYKHGIKQLTLFELLRIIKDEDKSKHVNDFLLLFPETAGTKGIKVTRSHVFEALWIIIFKLRLDDLFPSKGTRVFYDSVENRKEEIQVFRQNQ